jgi:hypothetical protein
MKKIALIATAITFLFQLSTFHSAHAQAPQGFTYQAAVRDAQGRTVAGRQVTVRIALVQGTALGTESYAEMHQPTTDAAGLFTITVGQGNALTNCTMESCVDWAAGPWFLRSQVDPEGGQNFTLSTTQQLMSVPYALYAANVQHDTVVVRDSVVVHIRDSVAVHYDTTAFNADTVWMTDSIEGMLPGRFSINGLEQVSFACGNLQYKHDGSRRFALHQYDALGSLNNYYSQSSYDGWMDLVLRSTGGWGVDGAIEGGGDSAGLWRVLSSEEWNYILTGRNNADSLKACATVNGVLGLLLLPDNWQLPDGLDMVMAAGSSVNVYTAAQWAILEAAGAVFLPAAGYVYDYGNVQSMGSLGYYATNTIYNSVSGSIYQVYFVPGSCFINTTSTGSSTNRVSVRAVHDIPRF